MAKKPAKAKKPGKERKSAVAATKPARGGGVARALMDEMARIEARLTALERIVRVESIQAAGDAVDQWWHAVHDGRTTPDKIEAAGMAAAKEALATKNKRRHAEGTLAGYRRRPIPR